MKINKKKVIHYFSILLSYILSLLFFLTVILSVLLTTICNKGYLKTQIIKSDFSALATEELMENYLSYGASGGFDANVMQSIITVEQVQKDMLNLVDVLYEGGSEVGEFAEVEDKAGVVLLADVIERDITVTADVKSGIGLMAAACRRDYQKTVTLPFLGYLAPALMSIYRPIQVWACILVGVCIFLMWYLSKLNKRFIFVYKYYIYAGSAAAFLCGLVPFVVKSYLNMEKLALNPLSLKSLVVLYANGCVSAFWYFAGILIMITLAIAFVGCKKNKEIQKAFQNF